jgi:hypothetical protein
LNRAHLRLPDAKSPSAQPDADVIPVVQPRGWTHWVRRLEPSCWPRVLILIGLLVAGLLGLLALEPIPQSSDYHRFADTRSLWGIPNFNDVASNAGFAVVGLLGILVVSGRRSRVDFAERSDAWPYLTFFIGVALVSVGSAYYHWAPSNDRLLWDRLPMSIAFMAFCSAIIADRIDSKAGNIWFLPMLIGLGFVSLVYWRWTESLAQGDLRFYGFVQFYPIIAIPAICVLFLEYRYLSGRYIAIVAGCYALSKLLEHFDHEVFDLLHHSLSGHTLKHWAAAAATFVVLHMLLARRAAQPWRERPQVS